MASCSLYLVIIGTCLSFDWRRIRYDYVASPPSAGPTPLARGGGVLDIQNHFTTIEPFTFNKPFASSKLYIEVP